MKKYKEIDKNQRQFYRNFQTFYIPIVFWMTGFSGAGKTSLAEGVAEILRQKGLPVVVLDGDILRRGLCSDLGFSMVDRAESNRRCAEVARLLLISAWQICICSLISPLEAMRQTARNIVGDERFRMVYVDCDLQTCIVRDPKGNYRKAQKGIIKGYTGLDDLFEPPANPDFIVNTTDVPLERSIDDLLYYIESQISIRIL